MADAAGGAASPVPDDAARQGAPARPGRAVAVVPLRDGTSGKSRLAHVLDPAARSRLVAVLARHVVSTLLASADVERVVVVTSDPRFAWRALRDVVVDPATADSADGPPLLTDDADRLRIVLQPVDRGGLNAAVEVGREIATEDGPVRVLVAHADLPALTTDDVAALLAEDAPVVVATDRHAAGTNLLALDPAAGEFRARFGLDSRASHMAEAERLGLRAVVVRRPGTATDLDTLDDWGELPADVRAAVGRHVPALEERHPRPA